MSKENHLRIYGFCRAHWAHAILEQFTGEGKPVEKAIVLVEGLQISGQIDLIVLPDETASQWSPQTRLSSFLKEGNYNAEVSGIDE